MSPKEPTTIIEACVAFRVALSDLVLEIAVALLPKGSAEYRMLSGMVGMYRNMDVEDVVRHAEIQSGEIKAMIEDPERRRAIFR